jgi:hypothetical protein
LAGVILGAPPLRRSAEQGKSCPRLDAAGDVLKEHFRDSDDREYRSRHGRIGFAVTARLQLDTDKVRAELGDRLPDFQRRVTVETLSLLE